MVGHTTPPSQSSTPLGSLWVPAPIITSIFLSLLLSFLFRLILTSHKPSALQCGGIKP
ncbi:hypothetical protein HanXRQr2_Chr06g0252461 [Helianthus annuus]|uniref:Uncharacterized protein n=1 Tax=Helianthus annuus TaxID=4232 RepID=A0A9K3NIK2_HELAN|nr:hypothetical protein HanXRQr2_Chr06g0252461 [Helianthus annuus]